MPGEEDVRRRADRDPELGRPARHKRRRFRERLSIARSEDPVREVLSATRWPDVDEFRGEVRVEGRRSRVEDQFDRADHLERCTEHRRRVAQHIAASLNLSLIVRAGVPAGQATDLRQRGSAHGLHRIRAGRRRSVGRLGRGGRLERQQPVTGRTCWRCRSNAATSAGRWSRAVANPRASRHSLRPITKTRTGGPDDRAPHRREASGRTSGCARRPGRVRRRSPAPRNGGRRIRPLPGSSDATRAR